MLTKHEQSKSEFGFWHNLRFGEGISKTVAQAKKNGDWLLFNLYRRDADVAGRLLFGPALEEGEWTVKAERGEIFRFGKDKDGYVTVEMFSNMDELSDAKLYAGGARFLSELADSARGLETSHPKEFQKMSAYPADIYRRPGSVSEDAINFESEEGHVEVELGDMPVAKRRRKI